MSQTVGICQKCGRHRTLYFTEVTTWAITGIFTLGLGANQTVCGIEHCNGIINYKGNYNWDDLPIPCWDSTGKLKKTNKEDKTVVEVSSIHHRLMLSVVIPH